MPDWPRHTRPWPNTAATNRRVRGLEVWGTGETRLGVPRSLFRLAGTFLDMEIRRVLRCNRENRLLSSVVAKSIEIESSGGTAATHRNHHGGPHSSRIGYESFQVVTRRTSRYCSHGNAGALLQCRMRSPHLCTGPAGSPRECRFHSRSVRRPHLAHHRQD